ALGRRAVRAQGRRGASKRLKWRALRLEIDAEMGGDRRGVVVEGWSRPQVAAAGSSSIDQERHILPGVVGARRSRIVSVVGCDDKLAPGGQRLHQVGKRPIERLQGAREPVWIVAVAELLVEIDEVGPDE